MLRFGAPILARYALDALKTQWSPDSLQELTPTLWCYREALPLGAPPPDEEPVTLGEGMTLLIRARQIEQAMGSRAVFVKDESLNPTNSFKARGLSIPVSDADRLEGISSVPEGGATFIAPRTLLQLGVIPPDASVVLFNTGGALKYLELLDGKR